MDLIDEVLSESTDMNETLELLRGIAKNVGILSDEIAVSFKKRLKRIVGRSRSDGFNSNLKYLLDDVIAKRKSPDDEFDEYAAASLIDGSRAEGYIAQGTEALKEFHERKGAGGRGQAAGKNILAVIDGNEMLESLYEGYEVVVVPAVAL